MKKFVITLIVLMLSACTQRFEYEPKAKDEEVDIAITSDIHYIDPELKDGETFIEVNERSDGKLSIYVEEITDKFIDTMIEPKALGTKCFRIILALDTFDTLAAKTNSLCFKERTWPLTKRAMPSHPVIPITINTLVKLLPKTTISKIV